MTALELQSLSSYTSLDPRGAPFNHASGCSVQCANRTGNRPETVNDVYLYDFMLTRNYQG